MGARGKHGTLLLLVVVVVVVVVVAAVAVAADFSWCVVLCTVLTLCALLFVVEDERR